MVVFLPFFVAVAYVRSGTYSLLLLNGSPFLGRVVVYGVWLPYPSSIFGSPFWSKSCSLATPSIPIMFLLPLLTTTRLGFDGSLMYQHWSTLLAKTQGSFLAGAFALVVFDGITIVVKYRSSFSTLLAHLTRNIGTFSVT